jgi:hypothetical protein
LEFVGLSDPLLRIAFWTGLISIVLIVLALLRILSLRITYLRRETKKRRFIASWRPIIVQWLAGDESIELPLIPKDQYLNFLLLWLHFHENLRGESTAALNRLGKAVHIEAYVNRLLRRSKTDQRLIAAAASGHLRLSDCSDRLWLYAQQRSSGLSLTAARALCQIDPVTAAEKVIPLMGKRTDWPMAKVAAILNEAGTGFLCHYIGMAETTLTERPERLPRLLRILGGVHRDQPLDLVQRILAENHPPELASAALRLICHPSELASARARLADPHWTVRVQAVTKLGALGTAADIESVAALLQDREWWVRYRAAQAIEGLSGLPARLKQVEAELHDPFGIDMLHHVIAESDLRNSQRVFRLPPACFGPLPASGEPALP